MYSQEEHSVYNVHSECNCYDLRLRLNREGDCLLTKLRSRNLHSAEDWEELLLPEIEW